MAELAKDRERDRDETGTGGATLASNKAKAHSIASKIGGVIELSKGGDADQRAAIDRGKATSGRYRDKVKRLHNSLEDEEGQRYRLIDELQRFRRAKDDFYWRM